MKTIRNVIKLPAINLFLFTAGIMILSGCNQNSSEEPESFLKDAYEDIFLIGAAVNEAIVSGDDAEARQIVIEHFNTITAENVLKAEPLKPEPGVYDFTAADQFVEFGEEHDLFIVGHTLVWHNQTPDWFFHDEDGEPNTPEAQIEQMRSHIEEVAGRYAGRIDAWDVVNEVIAEDGSYRPTTWVNSFGDGDEMVKNAFRLADEYAPDAALYYNDFNAWRPEKRDGIMRLVRMLQEEDIRIDGVGIQGHWGLNYPKNEYIEAAIDSFSTLGVKVMVTELDIDVLPLTREGQIIGTAFTDSQFQLEEFQKYLNPYTDGLPDDVQQQLTDRYEEIFQIFYDNRDKVDRITLWGVHDEMSWKNDYNVPGRTNYPLLFDRDYQPKPAVDAILRIPE